jgi:hypothetical protein
MMEETRQSLNYFVCMLLGADAAPAEGQLKSSAKSSADGKPAIDRDGGDCLQSSGGGLPTV